MGLLFSYVLLHMRLFTSSELGLTTSKSRMIWLQLVPDLGFVGCNLSFMCNVGMNLPHLGSQQTVLVPKYKLL